jgi:hypothetical protein
MTSETSEVTDLIRALRDGRMSLEEVAQRFRERYWPSSKPPPPDSYLEMASRALEDPRPDVPNSYDDVVAAYGRGDLSREEFDVLSQAVVDAKRARRTDH